MAALHHFHQGPFALFGFAGDVAIFFRREIVVQGQFQGAQRHPLHIEHEGFAHFNLAALAQMVLHPREQHGLATAYHAGERHDAARINGRFEIRKDLLVIRGVVIHHRMQTRAETEMLHDAAEHGRLLIVYRRAPDDAAHDPTRLAGPTSLPGGH